MRKTIESVIAFFLYVAAITIVVHFITSQLYLIIVIECSIILYIGTLRGIDYADKYRKSLKELSAKQSQ